MDFNATKKRILDGKDFSIKGSVDSQIVNLVNYINSHNQYVTTSSCAGRTVVAAMGKPEEGLKKKKMCKWLFTSHDIFLPNDLVRSVNPEHGDVFIKFEPFILHVLSADVKSADVLMKTAYNAGFRESGVSLSKQGRAMVAVRSNTQLVVPVCKDGVQLVDEKYLLHVAMVALEKFEANNKKILRFFESLKEKLQVNNGTEEGQDEAVGYITNDFVNYTK